MIDRDMLQGPATQDPLEGGGEMWGRSPKCPLPPPFPSTLWGQGSQQHGGQRCATTLMGATRTMVAMVEMMSID